MASCPHFRIQLSLSPAVYTHSGAETHSPSRFPIVRASFRFNQPTVGAIKRTAQGVLAASLGGKKRPRRGVTVTTALPTDESPRRHPRVQPFGTELRRGSRLRTMARLEIAQPHTHSAVISSADERTASALTHWLRYYIVSHTHCRKRKVRPSLEPSEHRTREREAVGSAVNGSDGSGG